MGPVATAVTDPLSSLLGGVLVRVMLVGTVVAAMAFLLRGRFHLAAGLVLALLVLGYLVFTDAELLR